MPISDKDLRAMVREFNTDHRLLLSTDDGSALQQQVRELSRELEAPDFNLGARIIGGAGTALPKKYGSAIDWMLLLPEPLRDVREAPLPEIDKFDPPTRTKVIGDGLRVLTLGAQTLVAGGGVGKPDFVKQSPAAIVQVAFGSDSISKKLRMDLVGPKAPTWPDVPELDSAKLQNLLRSGALHKLLRKFAECGYAAQLDRDWVAQVRPIGRVVALVPDRVCAGHSLTVRFEALGPVPPPDILLAVPTRTSCTHFRFGSVAPHLLDPARWTGSGEITVTLPEDVASGAVGFFSLPSPQPQTGPCAVGDLLAAAGEWQHILADQFEEAGIQAGTQVVNVATAVEAGRMRPLPCALPQEPGRENILRAGPPVIHRFGVLESGPVHPRGTLTLVWNVSNAEAVVIYARTAPGSDNTHELPNLPVAPAMQEQVTLNVPCTKRWEATIVLEASNGNGCVAAGSIKSEIDVTSGYSDWLVGAAKEDITDRRPGLPLAGFAYERQRSSGQVQMDEQDKKEVPLYARAFYIGENRPSGERRELCIVVADLWTATIAVKTEVLRRLNAPYGTPASGSQARWNEANVLIAGTHTHAGPGGYSDYGLYNLPIRGNEPQVFDIVVQGIVNAVSAAATRARPGRIYANEGDLANCGANRSLEASMRNPEFDLSRPESWTDRQMLLLKFEVDLDNRRHTRPLGALNWYAIHPTSLGMFNRTISGDNKGWGEMLFERKMASKASDFLAAFGNAAAGDVSGNVRLDASGRKTFRRPLGGPRPDALSVPPMISNPADADIDIHNMRELGQRQFEHAFGLYEKATFELTGRIDMRHSFIDMSQVQIDGVPGARTWPAMLGISFGAGSSEDSIAYASKDSLDIDAAIPEGMTRADQTAGIVALVGLLTAQLVLAPGAVAALLVALATRTAPAPSLLLAIWPLIAGLAIPGARAVAASGVASLSFVDAVPEPTDPDGVWSWEVPDPLAVDPAIVAGHGAKPIMFAVGLARLRFSPNPDSTKPALLIDCPLVPHILPMQLLRIGSLAVAAVPAEFTAAAGRRLKGTVRAAFGSELTHVVLSGYSNGYSGYVTTGEEYGAQHYEGASTLYGEHTLQAYQQTFERLVAAMISDTEAQTTSRFRVWPVAMRR